jgi:hypothetical protein
MEKRSDRTKQAARNPRTHDRGISAVYPRIIPPMKKIRRMGRGRLITRFPYHELQAL